MLYLKHLQILSIFIFCSLANASTLPDFTNIVDKNIDAVVIVNAVRSTNTNSNTNVPNIPDELKPFFERFFENNPNPNNQFRQTPSFGSGFILSDDGYVMTNNHVIENSSEITVTLNDGSVMPAKLIGTGIISTAIKKEKADELTIAEAIKSMSMLNKNASEILKKYSPNAVTDVTGFGLIGHLIELVKSSDISANINFSKIPLLHGTLDLANDGIVPGGSKRNLNYANEFVFFSDTLTNTQKLLTCDAQTSGGLLISLPDDKATQFISEYGTNATKIGSIIKKDKFLISVDK